MLGRSDRLPCEILRFAEKADLIVMGAKPHEGLAGHVPHTKAYRVISAAKCPVRSGANAAARPVTYTVGKAAISGSNLDARLDGDCVRGAIRDNPRLSACS